MTSRYLHLLREPQRHPGAPSVHRGDVPKLQGTGQRGSPRPKVPCPRAPPVAQHRAWGGAHHADTLTPPRTASWSARTSTTTTATSPTAPSAAVAARCSCAATTTAAGRCRGGAGARGAGQRSRSRRGAGGPLLSPRVQGEGAAISPVGRGAMQGGMSPLRHTDVCARPWHAVATSGVPVPTGILLGMVPGVPGPLPPAPSPWLMHAPLLPPPPGASAWSAWTCWWARGRHRRPSRRTPGTATCAATRASTGCCGGGRTGPPACRCSSPTTTTRSL